MNDKDTVVVVGVTDKDEWGNLWVTPRGGGDKIKIAKKREHLHSLFEQGKAVLLHWETYMDKPYVAKAEPVEGALPPPTKPYVAEEKEAAELRKEAEAKAKTDEPPTATRTVSGVEVGRALNDICALYIADKLHTLFGKENAITILKWWRGHLEGTLKLPVDGAKLPMWETKKKED